MIKKGKVFVKFIDYDSNYESYVKKYEMIPEEYIESSWEEIRFTPEGEEYIEKNVDLKIDYIWCKAKVVKNREIEELKNKRDKLNEILSLIE